MKIKRFKIKPDADIFQFPWGRVQKIIEYGQPGAMTFVNENSVCGFWDSLCHGVSINIAFPEDLKEWNDIEYILVLDEEFGQPYIPFYKYMYDGIQEPWQGLIDVINAYNEFMSSFVWLEEITYNENL